MYQQDGEEKSLCVYVRHDYLQYAHTCKHM
jgi:hypothetical protein